MTIPRSPAVAVCAFFLSLAFEARAQERASQWSAAVARISAGDTIRLWATEPALQGRVTTLQRIMGDTLLVTATTGYIAGLPSAFVPAARITRIDRRHLDPGDKATAREAFGGAAVGALIGIGAAGLFALSVPEHQDNDVSDRAIAFVIAAPIGMVAGGITGFVVGVIRGTRPEPVWQTILRAR